MMDYLSHKLGGEFARDPGLLPGLLMLIYLVLCGAYITTLMYRSSYRQLVGPPSAFMLVLLVNCMLILAPLWLIALVFEKFDAHVSDASLSHFIGTTLVTLAYRKLLIKWDRRKCQPSL
jgi:hypothetical protein